jgi:hypothetical protein
MEIIKKLTIYFEALTVPQNKLAEKYYLLTFIFTIKLSQYLIFIFAVI